MKALEHTLLGATQARSLSYTFSHRSTVACGLSNKYKTLCNLYRYTLQNADSDFESKTGRICLNTEQ